MALFQRSQTPRRTNSLSRPWKLVFTYGLDWVVTIAIGAVFLALGNVHGYRREFSLNDISLQYTYATKERVPNWALIVICLVAPAVIMPLINLATVRKMWDWHVSWLGLILSLAVAGSITNIVKITTGRPRPDVIDRCQPIPGSADHAVFGLSNSSICRQTDSAIMNDGFKSFPSGHASLSFAGLGFLSFYIAGKLHLFDTRGYSGKAWAALVPLMGAALVAITRTMDYRHHWHDVLIGGLLGLVVAYFAYRQYFPRLSDARAEFPFAARIPLEEPKTILPTHRTSEDVGSGERLQGGGIELHEASASGARAPHEIGDRSEIPNRSMQTGV